MRRAAQARAYFEGRDYVTPDDVKQLALPTLAHRLQIARTFDNPRLGAHDDEDVLRDILSQVPAPI
ncbi:MAG: hypothetical protein NTW86_19065 [Candidatus Sumerlaeota bacterium]|nr:hypothetical protein [Candidatus Sumerlaeota bacterium]